MDDLFLSGVVAMRLATIFAYLAGDRRAILDVASDRKALAVGAILVLSAALAELRPGFAPRRTLAPARAICRLARH